MSYNPPSDFVGLWRSVAGGVEKGEMPGLDFVIAALGRSGLIRVVTSDTQPVTNQSITAWFRPANPSFSAEGVLFLWNGSAYVVATPELFHDMLTSSNDPSVPGGGGGDGIGEAPNDGKQYGRQSLTWTEISGSVVIPPGGGGGGASDVAIISPTAPPSPTTGTEWWDGTTMWVWNGTIWQSVSAGATSLDFAVTQSTVVTALGNAFSWAIVPLVDQPQIDTLHGYDPITHKFTPKRPGYYAFSVRGIPAFGAGGAGGIAILKNDDGIFDGAAGSDIIIAISQTVSGSYSSQSVVGFAQMNGTTDYVRYWGYCTPAPGNFNAMGSNPVFTALHLA